MTKRMRNNPGPRGRQNPRFICIASTPFPALIQASLCQGKGKARAEDSDDGASVDSMMMDVDAAGSDFEVQSDDAPPPKKKATSSKKTTTAARAPAKKVPTKGRGKKAVASESEEVIELDDEDEDEEAPAPKKTSRAAVLR